MEHTFKIEKELKITTENIVDCVLSCEAGGFDYWGELCSDEKDYEAARQRQAEGIAAAKSKGVPLDVRPVPCRKTFTVSTKSGAPAK